MSWVNDLILSANRLERGRRPVSVRHLANVADEFCLRYRALLLDRSFRDDLEEAVRLALPPGVGAGVKGRLGKEVDAQIRAHLAQALRLLLEAGVKGEVAMEAIGAAEEALERESWHLVQLTAQETFEKIRQARKHVCSLAWDLAAQAAAAERSSRIKGAGIGLVGLAAVGIAVAPIATVPVVIAGGAAVVTAIGGYIFREGVNKLRGVEG
jgi:hypothetical protein